MSRSVSRKAFRARVAFLLLSFALISSACAGRDDGAVVMVPGSYTGVDGVVSDTSDASRIVTLSGDLTEFVFELGAGDSVVATDLTTVHPEAAVLVIGDTQTSPQSAIDQIRAAGVPFIILEVSTTFDIMYSKIDDLGLILGAEEAAASLASRLESDIEAAGRGGSAAAGSPSVAYVYTRGPDVMLLFGNGMVTHPVILAAGAMDAGSVAGISGSITVTPEALIAAEPDVIIVPSEGLEALGGVEGLLAIPGISQTPAGINGWILAYPEGDFLTIGPRIALSVAALSTDLADLGLTP